MANLRANGRMALTCVLPTNYRQVQLKGAYCCGGDTTAGDIRRAEGHRDAFIEQCEQVGLARNLTMRLWPSDLVLVRFVVQEMFNQTPGPSAGAAL